MLSERFNRCLKICYLSYFKITEAVLNQILCSFISFLFSLRLCSSSISIYPLSFFLDTELNHREFQKEVQILKNLRHRHLISLFAVCTASTPYYIITELMEKGNLLHFLRGKLKLVSSC